MKSKPSKHTHCLVAQSKKGKGRVKVRKKVDEYETLESGGHFEFDLKDVGSTDLGSHMCCDCMLTHHWVIEKLKGSKIRIHVYRDDYVTNKVRTGKK